MTQLSKLLIVPHKPIFITMLYYNREEHNSRVILVRKSSLWVALTPCWRWPMINISRVWMTVSSWGLPDQLSFCSSGWCSSLTVCGFERHCWLTGGVDWCWPHELTIVTSWSTWLTVTSPPSGARLSFASLRRSNQTWSIILVKYAAFEMLTMRRIMIMVKTDATLAMMWWHWQWQKWQWWHWWCWWRWPCEAVSACLPASQSWCVWRGSACQTHTLRIRCFGIWYLVFGSWIFMFVPSLIELNWTSSIQGNLLQSPAGECVTQILSGWWISWPPLAGLPPSCSCSPPSATSSPGFAALTLRKEDAQWLEVLHCLSDCTYHCHDCFQMHSSWS